MIIYKTSETIVFSTSQHIKVIVTHLLSSIANKPLQLQITNIKHYVFYEK